MAEKIVRRAKKIDKASEAAVAVTEYTANSARNIQTPKDDEDKIKLYRDHPWVHAAIYAIEHTVASLGFKLFKLKPGGVPLDEAEEVSGHPAIDLLQFPNPDKPGYDLFAETLVYLETVGRAYWEVVYAKDGLVGEPMELYCLRPTRVIPVPVKDGRGIGKYEFRIEKGTKPISFKPEQIVPFKFFDPLNDWLGMASIQASVNNIVIDQKMAAWVEDFFENGTQLLGMIVPGTGVHFTKPMMESIKTQLQQEVRGKRSIPIFSREAKFVPMGTDPKDAEFRQGQQDNIDIVLAVAGVPPVMVGRLEQAKYDNYRLQKTSFYHDTILPKLKLLQGCLDTYYLPLFPDIKADQDAKRFRYHLCFDTAELLAEDESIKVARLVDEIKSGMKTPNEARKELSLDEYAGGDKYYIDNRLVEVGGETEDTLEKREDEILDAVNEVGEQAAEVQADMQRAIDDLQRDVDNLKKE